jgi:PhnB protein
MAHVIPYLTFNGNTEEAFNFYKSVFGSEFINVQRFKDMPGQSDYKPDEGEKIMHISMSLGNEEFLMASDTIESMSSDFKIGNNFSLSINADSEANADKLFNGLSNGGKITLPLAKTFWGSYFGMMTDKFGIQWMVSYEYKKS